MLRDKLSDNIFLYLISDTQTYLGEWGGKIRVYTFSKNIMPVHLPGFDPGISRSGVLTTRTAKPYRKTICHMSDPYFCTLIMAHGYTLINITKYYLFSKKQNFTYTRGELATISSVTSAFGSPTEQAFSKVTMFF